MLRPRITPCLLVHENGLVKTRKFAEPKYVGDPINAVRIFNEKEVDEIIVVDIDASITRSAPNYGLIKNLAAECRMPLCYGGGVTAVHEIERVIGLGVEKVAVSAAAIADPDLVTRAATVVGSQSVVAVLDAARSGRSYEVKTHRGTRGTGQEPAVLAKRLEAAGAGEILINSIDRDGTREGYDLELVRQVREAVSLPITALGGAGSLDHIQELFRRFGVLGAAAGSLFVFKGVYRAVLLNYPNRADRDRVARVANALA
jgi:cyclase